MIANPRVIVEPIAEPVTLDEVKAHLRVDSTTEDDLLLTYISAARKHVENLTGMALMEQTLEYALNQWPAGNAIILPRATPLISPITSIKYKNSSGVETTWTSTNYIADVESLPGRVVLGYGISWPSFTPYPVSPIRVRYKAGLAAQSPAIEVDETIKLSIFMLVAGLFENREAVLASEGTATIREIGKLYGVDSFLAQHMASYVF